MSKQSNLVNSSQDVTVDSSGNVGIGTDSPAHSLHVEDSSASVAVISGTSGNSTIFLGDTADHYKGRIIYTQSIDTMKLLTNGSERMRIDSAGRVTKPYQPAFMVHATGDVGFTATQNVWADFEVFNGVDHNIGNHWNTTTRRFTCPISGIYHFYINVREETYYGSWGGIRLRLVKNGVSFAEVRKWDGSQSEETLSISITIECAANDIIHSHIYSDSSDTSLAVEGSKHTFFGGYLLG